MKVQRQNIGGGLCFVVKQEAIEELWHLSEE